MTARQLLLIFAMMLGLAQVSRAGDWPQLLGPGRNGVASDERVAAHWARGGPAVVWKRDAGQGFSGPAVANGKLILFHRIEDQDRVECLDAATGKPIWSSQYPTDYRDDFGFNEGPRATPTIAGERVYTHGAEGQLHCWDLKDGHELWAVDTAKAFSSQKGFFGRVCSPLVEGEAVILNIGGDNAGIVAFDKETGKVLWKATSDPASYSSPIAATFQGKRLVLVWTRSRLVALDPASGHIAYDYPFRSRMDASVNAASPVVIGDAIFLSASYGTGAVLLLSAGKEANPLWKGDGILSNHYATSIYRDGFLYGFDGRQDVPPGPSLRCIESTTGKVRWTEEPFGAGSIILAGDTLLILTEKGELIAAPASPDGFKPAARAQVLGFGCRAFPALSNGFLYARSKDKLVCLDVR